MGDPKKKAPVIGESFDLFSHQFARERDRGASVDQATARARRAVEIAKRDGTDHDVGRKLHAERVGAEVSDALVPDRELTPESAEDAAVREWVRKVVTEADELSEKVNDALRLAMSAWVSATRGQATAADVSALRAVAARLRTLDRKPLRTLLEAAPGMGAAPSDYPGDVGELERLAGRLPARYYLANPIRFFCDAAVYRFADELAGLADRIERMHLGVP